MNIHEIIFKLKHYSLNSKNYFIQMDEIFHLVREGNNFSVKHWIDCVENDFNLVDDHGFSLLHWASWDGHLSIVEILVNKGAKINCVNKCILYIFRKINKK